MITEGLRQLRLMTFVPPFFADQKWELEKFIQVPLPAIVPRQVPAIKTGQGIPEFFSQLLKEGQGIFFGNVHTDFKVGLVEFLIDQLDHLIKLGVEHIYFEVSAYSSFTDFEQFNHDLKNDGSQLEFVLRDLNVICAADAMRLFKAARERGIQVWPIDCGTKACETDLALRMRIGDAGMIRNILYFSKPAKKYLVLGGAQHHGIARTLQIANIFVSVLNAPYSPPLTPVKN